MYMYMYIVCERYMSMCVLHVGICTVWCMSVYYLCNACVLHVYVYIVCDVRLCGFCIAHVYLLSVCINMYMYVVCL